MSNRFFFKKKMRLLTRDDFQKVFYSDKRNIYPCFIVFSINNELNFPRLGIIVPKRIFKHAHKRNLIKRLIRESFRKSQYYLLHLDFVIFIKESIIKTNVLILKKFLGNLWRRYHI